MSLIQEQKNMLLMKLWNDGYEMESEDQNGKISTGLSIELKTVCSSLKS